jgi:hypothetical protein
LWDRKETGAIVVTIAGRHGNGEETKKRHCEKPYPAHSGLQAVSSPEANTLGIGGVAGLDDDIADRAAVAGDQVELVSVLRIKAPRRRL